MAVLNELFATNTHKVVSFAEYERVGEPKTIDENDLPKGRPMC